MPTTAGAQRQRGFTLLEVLVVLVLIGIITTFAVLAIHTPDPQERITREARRMQALITLAAQQAVLRSKNMGLTIGANHYGFLEQVDGRWKALNDPVLRERTLPKDIDLRLRTESDPTSTTLGKSSGTAPQVLLLASGEMTPFELQFSADNGKNYCQLTGQAMGALKLTTLGSTP